MCFVASRNERKKFRGGSRRPAPIPPRFRAISNEQACPTLSARTSAVILVTSIFAGTFLYLRPAGQDMSVSRSFAAPASDRGDLLR